MAKTEQASKIEPHFEIDAKMLPELEEWEVGKRYRIELEVEQTGLTKGDMYGMPAEGESKGMEGRFKIISAKALGKGSNPEKKDNPGPKKPLKSRFKEAKMGKGSY